MTKGRILYIEDNKINMDIIRKNLEFWEYELIAEFDGTQGVATARREKPNLILVDINLPDVDGVQIIRTLKASSDLSKIPVVALTADATNENRKTCVDAGANGFLVKPINRRELLKTLQDLLLEK